MSTSGIDNATENTVITLGLAQRFKLRAMELAKNGQLGALVTKHEALQKTYRHWVSLLHNNAQPVMIFGEEGAGKRRHVDEYFTLHNFYYRLLGLSKNIFKVFRGDFVQPGFTKQLLSEDPDGVNMYYIEAVDLLSQECQTELYYFLTERKLCSSLPLARIVLGTDKALSVKVLKKEFHRELFQTIASFAVFLPSLNERGVDMFHLVQSLSAELTGVLESPRVELVDFLAVQLWPKNFDELKESLDNAIKQKKNVSKLRPEDMMALSRHSSSGYFQIEKPEDLTKVYDQRRALKQALLSSGGNRKVAAGVLGLEERDLLTQLMVHGLR